MRLVIDKFKFYTDKNIEKDLKVVLVSDVHAGSNFLISGLTNMHSTIRGLKHMKDIDLIVMGGDYINNARTLKFKNVENNFRNFVEELAKIAPVLIARGNHDIFMNTKRAEKYFKDLEKIQNVKLIDNRQVEFNGIVVTGFCPRHASYDLIKHGKRSHKITIDDFEAQKFKFNNKKFHLVVTHSPFSLTNKAALNRVPNFFKNADVILSGHLHNGLFPSKNFEWLTKRSNNKSSKHLLRISIDKGFWNDPKTGFVTKYCRGAKWVGDGIIDRTILPSTKTYIKLDGTQNKKKVAQITGKGINKFSVIPCLIGAPSVVELVISQKKK